MGAIIVKELVDNGICPTCYDKEKNEYAEDKEKIHRMWDILARE